MSSLTRHLFVSPTGASLPRWLDAFPRATFASPPLVVKPPPATTLIWLRLGEDLPATEQLARLRASVGNSPVIVLADYPDDTEALALFAAGVRAYCNAHATAANLRQVARSVQAGGLWIGAALMERLLASTRIALSVMPSSGLAEVEGATLSAKRMATLTSRESEVAMIVAGGASNKEAARHLGITERTVKAHVGAVFEKLQARDRLDLLLIVNGHRPNSGPAAGLRQPAAAKDSRPTAE
jgi:DNA-binding NarL/FixJ family response regulator